jgi:hypothetical protein
MRTTVEFDDDTGKAIEAYRGETGRGVSEAVNDLIRRGLLATPAPQPFRSRTRRLGITIDVSNVAEALDLLEGPEAR